MTLPVSVAIAPKTEIFWASFKIRVDNTVANKSRFMKFVRTCLRNKIHNEAYNTGTVRQQEVERRVKLVSLKEVNLKDDTFTLQASFRLTPSGNMSKVWRLMRPQIITALTTEWKDNTNTKYSLRTSSPKLMDAIEVNAPAEDRLPLHLVEE